MIRRGVRARACLGMVLVCAWLLGLAWSGYAQDTTVEPASLAYGQTVQGSISNRTPRAVYTFDGLRGEAITARLRVSTGDLDALLILQTADGRVLAMRDDATTADGWRGGIIDGLRLPANARYSLVVTRFGGPLGSTSGDFALTVERVGVGSESGSALRYGDSIIAEISNTQPQLYYSFYAQQGDILQISMTRVSGDLDPYLQIVDSASTVIAFNDEVIGSPSFDAVVEGLVIQQTGVYVIVAARYGGTAGTSSGTFLLSLVTTENSGLRNTPQTAQVIRLGDQVDGELTNANPSNYFAFDALQNDLITIRMARRGGALDSYLALYDNTLRELASNDDAPDTQNAAIEQFLIPASGRYIIRATRFEGDPNGVLTVGRYQLQISGGGNVFDAVPPDVARITYGTTVTGRLDDVVPSLDYAFYGVAGDAVSVSLSRGDGNLDPVVALLDAQGRVLAQDDDGGTEQNARIDRYVLPADGVYYVRAARYSGTTGNINTFGSYILVLARRFG
jgi:hypothetical protein